MFIYFKNYGDKNFSYQKEDDTEISVIEFDEYFNHNDVIYDFLYCDFTNKIYFKLRNLEDSCNWDDIPLFLIMKQV